MFKCLRKIETTRWALQSCSSNMKLLLLVLFLFCSIHVVESKHNFDGERLEQLDPPYYTNLTSRAINLQWEPAKNKVDDYVLMPRVGVNGTWEIQNLTRIPFPATSYEMTGLKPDHVYSYKLAVARGSQIGPFSESSSFMLTLNDVPEAAPKIRVLKVGARNVTIEIEPPEKDTINGEFVEIRVLYWQIPYNREQTEIQIRNPDMKFYTIKNLKPNTLHVITARVCNRDSCGPENDLEVRTKEEEESTIPITTTTTEPTKLFWILTKIFWLVLATVTTLFIVFFTIVLCCWCCRKIRSRTVHVEPESGARVPGEILEGSIISSPDVPAVTDLTSEVTQSSLHVISTETTDHSQPDAHVEGQEVILQPPTVQTGTFRFHNPYIYYQGCVEIDWLTVWAKQVTTILMIGDLAEETTGNMGECWSKRDDQTFGLIKVKRVNGKNYSTYTSRTFKIKSTTKPSWCVSVYRLKNWSDHLTRSDCNPILKFLKETSALNPKDINPIMIYSSASPGSIGTIIILDTFLRQLRGGKGLELSIPEFLSLIRDEPEFVIPTTDQYDFIRRALVKTFNICTHSPFTGGHQPKTS